MAYNDQNKSGYPYPPPQYTPNPVPMQPEPHPLPPVITQQPGNFLVGKISSKDSKTHIFAPVHIVHIQAPPSVGPSPSMIVCPACRSNVMTRVELESSTRTHLMALGLCLLG